MTVKVSMITDSYDIVALTMVVRSKVSNEYYKVSDKFQKQNCQQYAWLILLTLFIWVTVIYNKFTLTCSSKCQWANVKNKSESDRKSKLSLYCWYFCFSAILGFICHWVTVSYVKVTCLQDSNYCLSGTKFL